MRRGRELLWNNLRNLVVDDAEALFREKGFEQTSMDEIAAKAGCGKSGLYSFFRQGKRQLQHAVIVRAYQRLCDSVENALSEKSFAMAGSKLAFLGRQIGFFYRSHPQDFHMIAFFESENGSFEDDDMWLLCCQQRNRLVKLIGKLVHEGIADRSLPETLDGRDTALVLWMGFLGLLNLAHNKNKPLTNLYRRNIPQLAEACFALVGRIRTLSKQQVLNITENTESRPSSV